jgi:surface protein
VTIADKLLLLNSTKTSIAAAIEDKGVTVGSIPFSQYPGKIAEISGGGDGEWVRPADWLPLPEVLATEQKLVGLYAVDDDDSNYVAILAQGAYTVDWGDGVVENFASAVQAEHQYNFASLPIESLSSRGYKQVVVTLTPQVGQSLVLISMNRRPAEFGNQQRCLQWLDVALSVPIATSLNVGSGTITRISILERFSIISIGPVTNMTSMFSNCASLQSVPLFDTSSVTNMSSMFSDCVSLQSVPLFNTGSVTSMTSMFNGCRGMKSVPLFNAGSVTDMSNMLFNCASLQSVPLFNTNSVTNMGGMFIGCSSLQSVPLFNAGSVTNMVNMLNNCTSIGRSRLTGVKITHSYAACNLSATALNEVFANLATVTGQTITITNNPGAATCDRTIATAKGWTVTG